MKPFCFCFYDGGPLCIMVGPLSGNPPVGVCWRCSDEEKSEFTSAVSLPFAITVMSA